MVLSCQEDIANVPEKSILHLLRAGSTRSKHLLNLVQNLISVLTAKVMGVSKKYLSRHTTGVPAYYHKTGRNAVDFYRIICIRDESFQDSEANTLRSFTSVPLLA